MATVSAEMVKKLREQTGAGMMDCKSALSEANGSIEEAIEILRKKGLKDLSKRQGKTAAEGTIGVYIHAGDQIVATVELNCETDFVARGEDFKELAKNLAMQVAAMRPSYATREDVPAHMIEKEKGIYLEQLTEAQKKNADKILPGKLEKFYQETVLLDQGYVKDDKVSVRQLVEVLSAKCGEKIVVRRFSRFEVGEGIERTTGNLADDVAEAISSVG